MGRWPSGETFTFEYLHVRVVRRVDFEGSYPVSAARVKYKNHQQLNGTFQNLCFQNTFIFHHTKAWGYNPEREALFSSLSVSSNFLRSKM